jgi:hypothetical protein
MKAKLCKREDRYDLYAEDDHKIASSAPNTFGKLSKQNCDEIFGIVDVDKWAAEKVDNRFNENDGYHKLVFVEGLVEGFNKAMELNKDKVFSKGDMAYIINIMSIHELSFEDAIIKFQSLQQPTEIEVMIVMKRVVDETKVIGVVKGIKGSGDKITTYKTVPKLDSEGCLILKKI